MSTMMYEQMEQYSTKIERKKLSNNARQQFMEERKNVYLTVPWSRDVWEEELTIYKDSENPLPMDVWSFVKDVKLTAQNVFVLRSVVQWYQREKEFDFFDYMKKHWNKGGFG